MSKLIPITLMELETEISKHFESLFPTYKFLYSNYGVNKNQLFNKIQSDFIILATLEDIQFIRQDTLPNNEGIFKETTFTYTFDIQSNSDELKNAPSAMQEALKITAINEMDRFWQYASFVNCYFVANSSNVFANKNFNGCIYALTFNVALKTLIEQKKVLGKTISVNIYDKELDQEHLLNNITLKNGE